MTNKTLKTFIIAEAGVNHNGDMAIAKKLIDAAVESGADAVKFQTFNADRLVSKVTPKAEYQLNGTEEKESHYEMIKRLELSEENHHELLKYCAQKEIQFLSSPFDEQSVDLLDQLGINIFKIPSGEITNLSFLEHVAQKGKPIILSTGMADIEEIQEAVEAIYKTGNKKLSLLHCTTEYPAPVDEVNLKAIGTLRDTFKIPVGFSDHTLGISIAPAAVALGATIIEKHFTLDRAMEGPDHQASAIPSDFLRMVQSIRDIESALGDGVKKAAPCEKKYIDIVRKSVVAANDISKDAVIKEQDIVIKRPGYGILPKDFKKVIGVKAQQNIKKDDVITWGLIK